jgi:hypothetical protein
MKKALAALLFVLPVLALAGLERQAAASDMAVAAAPSRAGKVYSLAGEPSPTDIVCSGCMTTGHLPFMSALHGILGALVAGSAGYVVHVVSGGNSENRAVIAGAAAVAGYPLGCAYGAYATGRRWGQDGRFLPALGGAYGGAALSVLTALVLFGGTEPDIGGDAWVALLGTAVALLPPIGATMGYNSSRSSDWLGRRVGLPGMAVGSTRSGSVTKTTLDLRMLTLRI